MPTAFSNTPPVECIPAPMACRTLVEILTTVRFTNTGTKCLDLKKYKPVNPAAGTSAITKDRKPSHPNLKFDA